MSDSILRIIPQNPEYLPSGDAQKSALMILRDSFREADEFSAHNHEEVVFVDAGENFDAIFCPSCKKAIDHDWWLDAMDDAASSHFTNLAVSPPCCDGSTTLNDLLYDMPQGFARFTFEVRNPNVASVPDALLEQLRVLLGCELRIIWARY